MKEIVLSNGGVAMVDDEDYAAMSKHSWYRNHKGYAQRSTGNKTVRMSRAIMGFPEGRQVDHKNRNRLDNQKHNLRVTGSHQNQWNAKCRVTSHTGVKGIGWHDEMKKFRVRVCHFGKRYIFGYFSTISEAIECYNREIVKLRGEFAVLAEIK